MNPRAGGIARARSSRGRAADRRAPLPRGARRRSCRGRSRSTAATLRSNPMASSVRATTRTPIMNSENTQKPSNGPDSNSMPNRNDNAAEATAASSASSVRLSSNRSRGDRATATYVAARRRPSRDRTCVRRCRFDTWLHVRRPGGSGNGRQGGPGLVEAAHLVGAAARVRMVTAGEREVGAADLLRGRARRDAQHLVRGHACSPVSWSPHRVLTTISPTGNKGRDDTADGRRAERGPRRGRRPHRRPRVAVPRPVRLSRLPGGQRHRRPAHGCRARPPAS